MFENPDPCLRLSGAKLCTQRRNISKAAWQRLPVRTGPDRHSSHKAATAATATGSHSLTGPVATAALNKVNDKKAAADM